MKVRVSLLITSSAVGASIQLQSYSSRCMQLGFSKPRVGATMASSFASLRSAIFDREEKKQQYQAHIRGLNAYDRHKKFIKDYVGFYGKEKSSENIRLPVKTDQDTLRERYRFIRSEEDDMDTSWEQRLVKRYYDKLFKEYCIADMSHYKSGKIGMRWRTEKEVVSGKGQFICGNKHCDEKDGLASYEARVNFSYFEAGENKQALVKLVTCERCAEKLHYKKRKEREKSERLDQEEHRRKRNRSRSEDDQDTDKEKSKEKRRKGKKTSASASDLKVDDDDHFDEFLEGMFP
ncbi:Folate-sensitive fragile site protein Fra10Ac [Trema orientale]|uniref:Folate-sensitive fragile site protein Fra10Ac n=1 Tax=Trema orientale TaxID=63057 RepID=A0A2P5AW40_TREOI|nr:Folate-sensitive fragile site protein Fra10Ac [Trema orientale]